MASGVECHFLTGYARQFVRLGAKRWVHHVDVLGPNLSQTWWKRRGNGHASRDGTWNNDARKRPFKEVVLPTIKANTPTSSFVGKGTISSLTTRMSAIAKPTRRACPSTPSWLSRWDGYVKLAVV